MPESEADSEAFEKATCYDEMARTAAKKIELDNEIAKMTVQIDQVMAKSAELTE